MANIPLKMYDDIIMGRTALWVLYKDGALEPTFFKIVPIVNGGILINMSNHELITIPAGMYGQQVTSRRSDGTLYTHDPTQPVNIERIDEEQDID